MKTAGNARTWTIATALISVLLLVAAWFLLVSPVLSEASATNADAAAQEEANDVERIAVNKLRAQYEDIELYEAQLAALQEQITTTQRYADLQRLVASIADEHDVVVTSLQFGNAETLQIAVPAAEEPAEPAEGEEAATEEAAAAEGDAATEETAAPAPTSLVDGLYSISVNLSFEGDYNDVLAALRDLQHGDQRIVLISTVSLNALDGEDAASDATELLLGGQTFVLVDPKVATEGGEELEEEAPAAVELPESTDNPLTPSDR